MKSKKNTFHMLYLLVAIGAAAIVFCAFGLARELNIRKQGRDYYTSLSSVINQNTETAIPTPAGNLSPEDVPGATEPAWTPYMDFEALQEVYSGLSAWIRCEGTVINYPVMQGSDNEYYLKHLPDGTENKMGSIFFDYRNATDFLDKNTVIYGHHMKTGDMFGSLENYKDQQFYDEHTLVTLHTQEKDYAVVLFAGYVANASQETLPLEFRDEADFENYVRELRQRSVFQSEVKVTADDRLVSLCTCTYDFKNARFILVGKLVEITGEGMK